MVWWSANDPDKAHWEALTRAMERNVAHLMARFESQVEEAGETLAAEIQLYLDEQENPKDGE